MLYVDIFQVPTSYKEAWDNPDPFQKDKWREGIKKESNKMEELQVWEKIDRS